MTFCICLLLLLTVFSGVSAESFVPEYRYGVFVWRSGDKYVSLANGRWAAGIMGGRSISFHTFLWHDDWVYKTLHGGRIESGPSLHEDGTVTLSGRFSARGGSLPIAYRLSVTGSEEGVRLRWELRKTGALPLTSGVWLHIFAGNSEFTGNERLWGPPLWHGTLSDAHSMMGSGGGPVESLVFELQENRGVALLPVGFRVANSEGSGNGFVFRLNLVPGEFEVGETVTAECLLIFADIPDEFPGEVKPMSAPLEIGNVMANAQTLACYDKLELTVDLSATYDNPYDPEDVALDAVFATPSGKKITVPGFFMVPHRRIVESGVEVMVPEGTGTWKVRFAPMEAGLYTWYLTVRDRSGTVRGGEGTFRAIPGESQGFVRVSDQDPHYLAFDNGAGYFPIGHNLPIYHTSGPHLAEEAIRKFAAAKENYNRWWMSSGSLGIEWMGQLGWYRQDAAARLDFAFDLALELGLYYMICMDTHQDFREDGWERNPFNAQMGGPCKSPADWFTNETARALYRKRLRYTVARWGYSPQVLAWEFGNEFEGWPDAPNETKLRWHEEMSDYLREIDPFGHLITTSFWGETGPEEFWRLRNIDIVQTHTYTNNDENVAEPVRSLSLHQWQRYAKPHIFGEFGIRSHTTTHDKDPEGWAIHNALWSGLVSFCAGTPMPWWHESYIDPCDLYFHFSAIDRFTTGLPLGTARWGLLKTTLPEYLEASNDAEIRDVTIIPVSRWGRPEHHEFTVLPDGTIAGGHRPQQLLHGQGHRQLRNPPTFVVNFPHGGRFILRVMDVSYSGLLRVWVDDELELERALPCGEGLGKSSEWRPEWSLWETTYEEDIAIDIPAGEHRVRVENFGKDWVRVGSYTFTGCQIMDRPNLLVAGMRTDDVAILWLQNRDSDWYNHSVRGKAAVVAPCQLDVKGLADGRYTVEWWDTWRGEVQRTETIEVRGGSWRLVLPEIKTDLALKLKRE